MRYSLHTQAQASLNSGINLRAAVLLPPGEDLNDWIAVHGTHISFSNFSCYGVTEQFFSPVVDFFNRINLIYGTISDYCTELSCPIMSGGPKFEYLWADGNRYKKPTQLPAPQYISLLMDWSEAQINNETLFPVSCGMLSVCHVRLIFPFSNLAHARFLTIPDVPFPKTFHSQCKKILTRLFRVFVHVQRRI